ncbi:SPARC-related modular calcium-binding protein 2-like isoform X1 [Euwallacea similis]|uniref:SPARC-related modular calcium-binding protein 2-like isoform X1 n=1 Tax=Euwallacea similis TaxID=1736056 RepID=UPI00344B80BE
MLSRIFFFSLLVWGVFCDETTVCYPKACQKPDNQKIVCGSDGLSYPNRCQLELVRCQNKNVTFVKRGPCKKHRTCLDWQNFNLDFPQYRFKARCKKSGAYEPGQCHPESGYCWCVTVEGLPIPGTAKERNPNLGGKPIRCGGGNKKKIARSPSRRKNRTCKLMEKAQFNNNLMNSFHSEYMRELKRNDSDNGVIIWKFESLDTNHDQVLDKREYRDIKRLVSKAMKPKKCAKAFPKSCDMDNDGKITSQEWLVCLPRDGYTVFSRVFWLLSDSNRTNDNSDTGEDTAEDYEGGSPFDSAFTSEVLDTALDTVTLSVGDENESIDSNSPEEQTHGCLADRKTALDEADSSVTGNFHNASYIPECTVDGRYKKVQCYPAVAYCWCVNEDDGNSIAGTSVKGGHPNCDNVKPIPPPMKGCSDDKKLTFLQELMHFLKTKMNEKSGPSNPALSLGLIHSNENQAVWCFNFLDKNRNKVLERSEWKSFKDMVAPIKGLKKCGKKLPRYCDSNKDREISMTEWLDCLNVKASSKLLSKDSPLRMLKDD